MNQVNYLRHACYTLENNIELNRDCNVVCGCVMRIEMLIVYASWQNGNCSRCELLNSPRLWNRIYSQHIISDINVLEFPLFHLYYYTNSIVDDNTNGVFVSLWKWCTHEGTFSHILSLKFMNSVFYFSR